MQTKYITSILPIFQLLSRLSEFFEFVHHPLFAFASPPLSSRISSSCFPSLASSFATPSFFSFLTYVSTLAKPGRALQYYTDRDGRQPDRSRVDAWPSFTASECSTAAPVAAAPAVAVCRFIAVSARSGALGETARSSAWRSLASIQFDLHGLVAWFAWVVRVVSVRQTGGVFSRCKTRKITSLLRAC